MRSPPMVCCFIVRLKSLAHSEIAPLFIIILPMKHQTSSKMTHETLPPDIALEKGTRNRKDPFHISLV